MLAHLRPPYLLLVLTTLFRSGKRDIADSYRTTAARPQVRTA